MIFGSGRKGPGFFSTITRLVFSSVTSLRRTAFPTVSSTNWSRMGKELYGETVHEIADELGVSAPRIYQLIARAKEIGRTYREETK